MKSPAVYIMASRRNGTLYVGVTADLPRRAFEHREGMTPGFARRYGCELLVYYEAHEDMNSAIAREKQLKAGSRKQKLALIETMNPEWRDLYPDFA
jgi:putative endonuclease